MREPYLSCCISNRSGVLVRVRVRMDPMCLREWEWGSIRRVWEGRNKNGSNMVGRSEDGSGSGKVRISRGDTKPLRRSLPQPQASDPLFLSSKLSPIKIFARGFVSPQLILTFTLPDPSSLLPIMLDPFSVLPSQTRRIHHHSHCKWGSGLLKSRLCFLTS